MMSEGCPENGITGLETMLSLVSLFFDLGCIQVLTLSGLMDLNFAAAIS